MNVVEGCWPRGGGEMVNAGVRPGGPGSRLVLRLMLGLVLGLMVVLPGGESVGRVLSSHQAAVPEVPG